MWNFIKIIEENRKLKELVNKQNETLMASLRLNAQYEKENKKLRSENNDLHQRIRMLCDSYHFQSIFPNKEDIIYPNTDERGLGEGDTPNDLSPLDL